MVQEKYKVPAKREGTGFPIPSQKFRTIFRLLAEVAVQQASESLAVAGLVASHLVNGALAALAGRFASYGTLLLWLLCFYRKVPIF